MVGGAGRMVRSAIAASAMAAVGVVLALLLAAPAVGSGSAPAYNLGGSWSDVDTGTSISVNSMNMSTGVFSATGSEFAGATAAGTETGCTASITQGTGTARSAARPARVPHRGGAGGTVTLTVLPAGNLAATGAWGDGELINWVQTSPASATPAIGCTSSSGGAAASATQVTCSATTGADQCTATVSAGSGTTTPTGTVQFALDPGAPGELNSATSATCSLAPGASAGTASCWVDYTPAVSSGRQPPVHGTYLGDASFGPSSGQPGYAGTPPGGGSSTTTTTGSGAGPTTGAGSTTTTTAGSTTTTTAGSTTTSSAGTGRGFVSTKPEKLASAAAALAGAMASLVKSTNSNYLAWMSSSAAQAESAAAAASKAAGAAGSAALIEAAAAWNNLAAEIAKAEQQYQQLWAQQAAKLAHDRRVARTSGTAALAVVPRRAAIRLALPRGRGAAVRDVDRLLRSEATLVSWGRVLQLTARRGYDAEKAGLTTDAKRQLTAVDRYARSAAAALTAVTGAEHVLSDLLITKLRRRPVSTAQLRTAISALAHPSPSITADAKRLGLLPALRAVARSARRAGAPTIHRAAAVELLSQASAGFVSSGHSGAKRLDSFATLAGRAAALL